MKIIIKTFFLFCTLIFANQVMAGEVSYFASLKANDTNLRMGPGRNYPIDWIFKKKGMPVEVVAEFDNWRKIRDVEGSEGWVHQSMLSSKKTAVVMVESKTLHKKPYETSRIVAKFSPNVICQIDKCENGWCKIEARGYEGWATETNLWGFSDKSENSDKEPEPIN